MDIARAFSFAFQDPEWTERIGLGTVISIVPILNFASVGYEVEIARQVMRGESRPLPRWDDLGRLWKQGGVLFLAALIYRLPLFVLLCGPLTLFVPVLFAFDERRIGAAIGVVLVLWSLACSAGFFLGIVVGFFIPAIYLQYVRHGTFAACFDLSAIMGTIRGYGNEYLVAWLGTLCAGLIYGVGVMLVSLTVSFIPFVGWAVQFVLIGAGVFWLEIVTGHLVGQLGARVPGETVSQLKPQGGEL